MNISTSEYKLMKYKICTEHFVNIFSKHYMHHNTHWCCLRNKNQLSLSCQKHDFVISLRYFWLSNRLIACQYCRWIGSGDKTFFFSSNGKMQKYEYSVCEVSFLRFWTQNYELFCCRTQWVKESRIKIWYDASNYSYQSVESNDRIKKMRFL